MPITIRKIQNTFQRPHSKILFTLFFIRHIIFLLSELIARRIYNIFYKWALHRMPLFDLLTYKWKIIKIYITL